MKAIVAEIDKKQMIVITDKGDFIKVKRQLSASIGDEIELMPRMLNPLYRRAASLAACFLACIFLSTGVYAYYTPYSYVSVDINPSIALSLNRFERVIAVEPLTEDAVGLIEAAENIKNHEIEKALSEIIKSASENGFISEETENQVMVVVSAKSPKQEEKLAAAVNTAAAGELSKVSGSYGVTVEKTSVEKYKAALSNKLSPGKEILADRLREVKPEIKAEEARNMSVKDAMKLIKEGKKQETALKKDKGDSKDTGKDKDGKNNGEDRKQHAKDSKDKDKKSDKAAASDFGNKSGKEDDRNKPAAAGMNKDKGRDGEPKAAARDTEGKDGISGKQDKDTDRKDKDEKDDKDKKDEGKKDLKAKEQKDSKKKESKDDKDPCDNKSRVNKDRSKSRQKE